MNFFLHFFKICVVCYYVPKEFFYLKLFVILQTLWNMLFFYKLWKLKMKSLYWISLFYKYMLAHRKRMCIYSWLILMKLIVIWMFLLVQYFKVVYSQNKQQSAQQNLIFSALNENNCIKWSILLNKNQIQKQYLKYLTIVYCFCVSELSFISLNLKINFQKMTYMHCLLGTFYLFAVVFGLWITLQIQNSYLQIFAFQNYLLYVYKAQIKSKKLKKFTDLAFIITSSYQICRLSLIQFANPMETQNFETILFGLGYLFLILNSQIQNLQKQSLISQENKKCQQNQEQIRQIKIIYTLMKKKKLNFKQKRTAQNSSTDEITQKQCSICFDSSSDNQIILDCSHFFHQNCILSWFIACKKGNCPMCRSQLALDQSLNNKVLIQNSDL